MGGVQLHGFVCGLEPVYRKPRKLFGPAKPFFVICILKTEKPIGPKLCMEGTSLHIKSIIELNSSVIIRFEILLWLSGRENFSGPSRNGPLATIPRGSWDAILMYVRMINDFILQEAMADSTTSQLESSERSFGAQSPRKVKTNGAENDNLKGHSQDSEKPAEGEIQIFIQSIHFFIELVGS